MSVVRLDLPLCGCNAWSAADGGARPCDHNVIPREYRFGLRFFLSPVLFALSALRRYGFPRVTLVGHSGGAWTATVLAALYRPTPATHWYDYKVAEKYGFGSPSQQKGVTEEV